MRELKKMLNIGNSYFVEGGDTRYMFFLEDLLKSEEVDVIPFAPKNSKNHDTPYSKYFPKAINIKQSSYIDFPGYVFNIHAKRCLSSLLANERNIQLAHLHIYYGRLTTSILKPLKKAGIPIIQTLHEYKLACPVYSMISNGEICDACKGHSFWQCIIRKCNRNSYARSVSSAAEAYFSKYMGNIKDISHFLPSSDFLKSKMTEIGISEDKMTTLHNFVNTNHFNQKFSFGDHFVYIGRIEKLKGIFTLVQAFQKLPHLKLIIVGTGEAENKVKEYIALKNLQNIQMVGFKQGEELFQIVENAIASIIPSEWYENCPLSAFESFAIGKPIIGSKIGGIPELIEHGKNGFLFEPRNVDELANYVGIMASNKKGTIEMGYEGYLRVRREFNPQVHFEKLYNVYKKYLR